jgi:hypothetical protein
MDPVNLEKVGKVVTLPPEPLVPDETTFVAEGPIRIGVERRHITTESLRALYQGNPDHAAAFEARVHRDGTLDDRGVSIHVLSAATGHEYLRFDCFDEDPHYHYIHHEEDGSLRNRWVIYDAAANGAMLPWALDRLRHHLGQMLAGAGAEPDMVSVDGERVGHLVDQVASLATA